MSSETASEQDQVIALMTEQGISRVKATKLLYEQSKQKKKDDNKVEINVAQRENSVVKNQIDRFNSQRDLSNVAAPVHHDIDMSQDGRPVLKLDTEASFRYISTGPRISPSTNILANTPDDPTPQETQSVKKFPLRAKVDVDTGSDDEDEVVAPYEEDKYNDSPAASKNRARVETRTVAGAISGFDDAGWNGEIEEDQDGGDAFNALTASMPNATPRRRSSNASLNSLRPLSRLHPNKFRDSMSTDPCDLDDEDYSDSEEEEATGGAAGGIARPPQHGRSRRKDTDAGRNQGESLDGSFGDLNEASSSRQVTHSSNGTQRTTTITTEHRSSAHSSAHTQSTHSLTFSPNLTPTGPTSQHPPSFGEEPRLGAGNSGVVAGGNKMSPPINLTNEQRQQQFSHGAQGSWSSGAQSSTTSSAESKSALAQQSAKIVQQLAVEEKMALLNAGRSPRHANTTTAPKLTPPSPASQQAAVNAMNVKVGTKKLTIRGAQQSQSQEELLPPPPGYAEEGPPPSFDQQQRQQRSLPAPPPPPPAYDESMMDDLPRFPAEESLPDFLPDSDEEDEDGMNQEQRTVALMAKYKRRSYMKPNATPEAFRDLEPVDPAVAKEALLRREQELKNAATWVPPASIQTTSATSNVVSTTTATTSSNVNTTESLAGGTVTPPSQVQDTEEYVHVVPTHTAVEAVMHKESNDLIEELVQQGYSRENAISLAKEIELDRRGGRFYNNQNGNFSPAHGHSSYANGAMSWQEAAAAANNAVKYTTYNNSTTSNHHLKNAAYGGMDDDLGSVISNISAASRQSNFGETDRLLMNLLLTQQKTRYGVNMYESLENSDEPLIERYMNKGMSLDQAVLKVFERKYGPVESQQLPRQVMSNNGAGGGSVSGSSIAVDSDEAHEIVAAMHAEIELLMLSGNYSREVAVRMLLNKVAKERALKQQHAGSLSLELDMDPPIHPHHAKSMHRASSMNAMGSPTGRGGYVPGIGSARGGNGDMYAEHGYYGATAYQEGASERRLHSARSMYDSHSSRNGGGGGGGGGGSVVSERSNRSHNMPVPHHLSLPGDHLQDDYVAHYHEQEYMRGPNGPSYAGSNNRERSRSGDKYIIHHHYQAPPPTPVVQSTTTHTSNLSVTSNSHNGGSSRRRPSTSNTSVMSGTSSRGVEDNAYIPTLLAEQEAKYGVNMFEYLAPDDPEVSRLMREFNFTRTDAMIAVFQQFPPQVVTPTPTHLNSATSIKSTSSGGTPKGIAAHSPMKPPLINTNYNNLSANSMHSSGSQSGSHATANNNRPLPVPSTANSSAYDEDAELERVMKLSMQEHNNKPGAVSMPGTNSKATSSYTTSSSVSSAGNSSRAGGGSSQDVATLVGMGFTHDQAQAALARHNFDVHKAADYLLGCM